jgi:hypothetical protein
MGWSMNISFALFRISGYAFSISGSATLQAGQNQSVNT